MTSIEILEKEIKITQKEDIIRGSKNYFKCKVIFNEFWKDFEKTIVFKSIFKNTPFMVYVSEMETEVTIPLEVLTESGTFKIGAFGVKENITLPTLWSEELKVLPGSDTSGELPQPNETVYEQILKKFDAKQDALISGKNIKTINGQSVLGSGNIEIQGGSGGGITIDQTFNPNSENAQSGKAVAEALATVKVDLSGYYTKEETDAIVGDIDVALDGIIAIQNELIGGGNK